MNRGIFHFFNVLSIFILVFFCINNVGADYIDFSSGSTSSGNLGSGDWSPGAVGIKVSVINSSKNVKSSKIILNSNGRYNGYFSTVSGPKIIQSNVKTSNFSNTVTTYTYSGLPSNWIERTTNGIQYFYSIESILESNSYKKLKYIIEEFFDDVEFTNNDYIIIEPMVKIGKVYATAYEFGQIIQSNACSYKTDGSGKIEPSTFCYKYSSLFLNKDCLFCNTIYIQDSFISSSDNYFGIVSKNVNSMNSLNRYNAVISQYGNRGIGVYKYSDLFPGLTITKKDSVTGEEISRAGFRIHSGSGCTGAIVKNGLSTNSSGKITVDNLAEGSYSIYEVLVPSGYATPTNRCTNVTITEGSTTPVTIYNDPKGDLVITKKDSATGKVISGAGFRIHSGSGCTGSIVKTEQKTNTNGVISITGLTAGSYSIYESTIPSGYQTPTNRCTNVTVTGGVSTPIEIKNNPFPSLVITKTDNLDNPITGSKATFSIYSNKWCQGSAMYTFKSGDEISFNTSGVYYLKETKAPNGYHTPEVGDSYYCTAVNIKPGKNQLKIKNKSVCETEFESSSIYSDPNNINYAIYRVNLYNKLLSEENQDFRMLLDFSKTKAEEACQALDPKYTSTTSCLTTTQNNAIFNEGNVSMYTERVGSFNRTFCLTTYELNNNLGSTSGFGVVKSGQLIKSNSEILATGTLKRVCYSYDTTGGSFESGFKYNNYVTSTPTLDGKVLEAEREVSSGGNRVTCSGCKYAKQKYEKTISVNYKLPLLYASNMDGRIYTYCPSDKYCKVLGRGIETIFNLAPTVKINSDGSITRLSSSHKMNFVIEIQGEDKEATCEYDITNELITEDDNLQLEFRTVTTNSSTDFLDKQGNIRDYGSNWSSEQDRVDVLDKSNNSYNKKNEDPIYTITLTPSIMSEIRQYNKNTSYSDFNFVCKNDGEICISNYLTELRDTYGLEIYSTNTKRLCVEQNICP